MAKSMTAFAYKECSLAEGNVAWEIRSVNHRYLDASLRLPEDFRSQENAYREQIKQKLKRGKVEVALRFEINRQSENEISVNEPLARALIIASRQIESLIDSPKPLGALDVLNWPGVAQEAKPDIETLFPGAAELLDEALDELVDNRLREGNRLAEFVFQRCDQIAEIIVKLRKHRPGIVAGLREKMLKRIAELNVSPDQERLEQELVIIAQRLDVDEELDRLMAHLDEINAILERDEAIGRRLDFLMQELNREANTLASKSNDAQTTQWAVDLKVLIEQMREQIQNLE
jgi:uncharacterized protein (TIGR00255 family)